MGRVDRALLGQLHGRLLSGDRTASEELAALLLPALLRELAAKFPFTDRAIVSDGVTDAVLEYCLKPDGFDTGRGVPLDRFLYQAGWRNVANLVRGEARRKAREEKAAAERPVEHDRSAGNNEQESAIQQGRQEAELMKRLQNPRDRQILKLRLRGERKTEAFAKLLGITHLPLHAQRREVKRAKDRIDKIIRRT